jgi:dephospho-CoA kinase
VSTTNQICPLRIGLTGGIASGKTTVANMFADLDVPVIDTDIIARQVVQPGEPALEEIRECFGDTVIDESGNLDRRAMRKLIFSDDNLRLQLEGILHPTIGAETRLQSNTANGPYQLIVVPLLVGSPLLQFVDRVLVIDCDEETQIQRLLARDAETRSQAHKILSAQARRDDRLAIADDVISNDQGLTETREQVALLDQKYRKLAGHCSA